MTPAAQRCRRKFLRHFPDGFRDVTYLDWERDYKWTAHLRWQEELGAVEFDRLIAGVDYEEVAGRALRIESRTNLLFSFEKMALRDTVRTPAGAMAFSEGLHRWLRGGAPSALRFRNWTDGLSCLADGRRRVLSWPVATVFGFLARPRSHVFFKPVVTRRAASAYGVDLPYVSRPNWSTYQAVLRFARRICREQADLGCRDLIDAQSFIWVLGSDEY